MSVAGEHAAAPAVEKADAASPAPRGLSPPALPATPAGPRWADAVPVDGLVTRPGDVDERRADVVRQRLDEPAPPRGTGGRPPGGVPAPPGGQPDGRLPAPVRRAFEDPGEPLSDALVGRVRDRFAVDVSTVRVHRGPDVDAAAGVLGATAFTVGTHVGVSSAVRLDDVLTHELGHVIAPPGSALIGRQADPAAIVAEAAAGTTGAPGTPPPGPSRWVPIVPIGTLVQVVDDMPDVFATLAAMRPQSGEFAPAGTPNRLTAEMVRPIGAALYTENVLVILDDHGRVSTVDNAVAPAHELSPEPVLVLNELRSGRAWIYYGRQRQRRLLDAGRRLSPMPRQPAGMTMLRVYLPGYAVPDDERRTLDRRVLRRRIAAGPPGWARQAADRLTRRHRARDEGGSAPGSAGTGERGTGPGAGERGTGTGGGGTSPTSTEQAGAGTGTGAGGAGSGERAAAGPGSGREPAGPTRRTGVLRGPATYEAALDGQANPVLKVTIDRAVTRVPLIDGESTESLERRVDAAVEALARSRDPDLHESVGDGARPTGFVPPPPGSPAAVVDPTDAASQARGSATAATPGERPPGMRGGANAPEYPSTMTMIGTPAGQPVVTTAGATNRFAMTLDYASRSLGLQDEVWNRLQRITYYWEIIDVTGVTVAQARARGVRTRVGGGREAGPGGGLSQNLARTADEVAEDQRADIAMMAEQHWPWEARAAYLAVIGLSNSVRLLGSIIGSFIDALTQPLNERSIGFEHYGDFLVRCVATPVVSDEARADPGHHIIRASSIAVLPVRIEPLSARAGSGADAEAAALTDARARAAAARERGEVRTAASYDALATDLERRSRLGGSALLTEDLQRAAGQLTVARSLVRKQEAGLGVDALTDEEVGLEIRLRGEGRTARSAVTDLERAILALRGEGGEHQRWVQRMAGGFVPIGGRTEFRPRMALASSETGQVTPLRTTLGRLADASGQVRWALVDLTSSGTRDRYVGTSSRSGPPGEAEAIRNAFRGFAENAGYGRGTVAIRLPAELGTAIGGPLDVEPLMRSAPGARGRALQRLQDIATVAEVVGIFATGGLGLAVGVVGGLAGAIVAADSIARRSRTGHLVEFTAVFDLLGVIGGVAAVGGLATAGARTIAEAGRASGRLPGWVGRLEATEHGLHVFGTGMNVAQMTLIPVSLLHECAQIEAGGGSESEKDARRARAILGAIRSGAVTTIMMGGGLGGHPGETPAAAQARAEPGVEPGPGTARAVAEGSTPPRPPAAEPAPERVPPAPERVPPAPPERVPPAPTERVPPAPPERARTEGPAAEPPTGAADAVPEPAARTSAGTPRTGTADPAAPIANLAERGAVLTELADRAAGRRPAPAGPDPAARGPRPRPGDHGTRTTVAAEALASFDAAVAISHGAEVGLFFNPNTGEFAVRIGTETTVSGPAGDGWHALVHLHPNPGNVLPMRLPAPADVSSALAAAGRTGSHTEYVMSTLPDGGTSLATLTVTLNPPRILVELPGVHGEPPVRIDVDSPQAYAREYGAQATYLDPASPLYRWVMNDIAAYLAGGEGRGSGRTAAGTDDAGGPTAGTGEPERTAMGTVRPAQTPGAPAPPPPRPRHVEEILDPGGHRFGTQVPLLRSRYDAYVLRVRGRGRLPMGPAQWATRQRGSTARQLDAALDPSWRQHRRDRYPGYHPELIDRPSQAPEQGSPHPQTRRWTERRIGIDELRPAVDTAGDPYWTFPDLVPGQVLILPSGTRVWLDPASPRGTRTIHEEHPASRSVSGRRDVSAGEDVLFPADELATPTDHQRLHGAGSPGLGFDSPYSVAYGSPELNLAIENAGIERWVRQLRDAGTPVVFTTETTVTGRSALTRRVYHVDVQTAGGLVRLVSFEATPGRRASGSEPPRPPRVEIVEVDADAMAAHGFPRAVDRATGRAGTERVDLPPGLRERLGFGTGREPRPVVVPELRAALDACDDLSAGLTRVRDNLERLGGTTNFERAGVLDEALTELQGARDRIAAGRPGDAEVVRLRAAVDRLAAAVRGRRTRVDPAALAQFRDAVGGTR